jgi:peroxiredoxin Q/BCP
MLKPGDKVPDLPLQRAHAGEGKLSDYRKSWLVLYFYPKDNTPGCTTEGNDFNALLPKFKALNAEILGVSRDSLKTHQNFCAKQGFDFDLHADTDEAVCNAFGVIQEKSMYGKKMMGIVRSTFLIAPDGKVATVWSPVKVKEHAATVLEALAAAQ